MLSLKELCQKSIVESVLSSPPEIREMITEQTKEQIRNEIREELKAQIIAEKVARKEMLETVSYLVPDIIKDIIYTMTNHNTYRKNFYELWSNVPENTVRFAITIAENTVSEMEERYVYSSFQNSTYSMSSEEDSYIMDHEMDY